MIENVLNEVYKIISEKKVRKYRSNYNIFKVLEMSDKEVLMCRVLADFLNPNGMHGKGTKYLEQFLDEVLHRKDYKLICEKAHNYY